MFQINLNKSPGSDGLSVKLFREFLDILGESEVKSLNEGYRKDELSDTHKHGILNLIFKKGNHASLHNWRPITLLNNDYKLAALVIATRLNKVLPSIINSDQNGYVKGRFIGFNVRQIQDLIDFADDLDISGAILFFFLNFTKAFDSVEWRFMYSFRKN